MVVPVNGRYLNTHKHESSLRKIFFPGDMLFCVESYDELIPSLKLVVVSLKLVVVSITDTNEDDRYLQWYHGESLRMNANFLLKGEITKGTIEFVHYTYDDNPVLPFKRWHGEEMSIIHEIKIKMSTPSFLMGSFVGIENIVLNCIKKIR